MIAETVEDERRLGGWRFGRVDLLQRQLGQLPGLRQPSPFLKGDQALHRFVAEAPVNLLDAETEIVEPLRTRWMRSGVGSSGASAAVSSAHHFLSASCAVLPSAAGSMVA